MKCRICASESELFGSEKILGKHLVSFFRCPGCGFLQTQDPFWLEEAYSCAITNSDIGLVYRNLQFKKITGSILKLFFRRTGAKFIDYGAGYGLLVRLMRDAGYDFYYYDKHCENIFAKQFEAGDSGEERYELLTAFEVFEHMTNPLEEVEKMLGYSRNILFTTEILPANTPKLNEWWYYSLDHGQHVSFFTMKSLSIIAGKHGLNLYSDGKSLHLLSEKRIPQSLFRLISLITFKSHALLHRKSLILSDYKKITGKSLV